MFQSMLIRRFPVPRTVCPLRQALVWKRLFIRTFTCVLNILTSLVQVSVRQVQIMLRFSTWERSVASLVKWACPTSSKDYFLKTIQENPALWRRVFYFSMPQHFTIKFLSLALLPERKEAYTSLAHNRRGATALSTIPIKRLQNQVDWPTIHAS